MIAGLRAGDAEQQFGELLCGDFHRVPPGSDDAADVSIRAMFDWRRPTNLGVKDGRLAPCRRTPNCVSSQADPADARALHRADPFRGDAMAAVRSAVEAMPRTTIVPASTRTTCTPSSAAGCCGFVDDVEFFYDGSAIQVRSASRLGRRDFGVNRKRVESCAR